MLTVYRVLLVIFFWTQCVIQQTVTSAMLSVYWLGSVGIKVLCAPLSTPPTPAPLPNPAGRGGIA